MKRFFLVMFPDRFHAAKQLFFLQFLQPAHFFFVHVCLLVYFYPLQHHFLCCMETAGSLQRCVQIKPLKGSIITLFSSRTFHVPLCEMKTKKYLSAAKADLQDLFETTSLFKCNLYVMKDFHSYRRFNLLPVSRRSLSGSRLE